MSIRKISLLLILSVVITLGLSVVFQSLLAAWTAPLATPPNCTSGNPGCDAPVNIGPTGQSKQGGLILNTVGMQNGLIVQSGNVGIGTTNPNEKIEIAEIAGARGIFSDGGGSSRKVILFEAPGTTHPAYGRIASYNYGGSSGLNLVLNDTGGNVGIGATGPSQKLEVAGNALFNIATSKVYFSGTSKYVGAGRNNDLSFINNTASWMRIGSNGGLYFWGATGADTNDTPHMVLNTSGNVGIGTVSPTQKLDVSGYVRGSSGLCIGSDCRTGWPSAGTPSQWTTSGSNIYYNTGNVGIGITNPSYKLQVEGSSGIYSHTSAASGIGVFGSSDSYYGIKGYSITGNGGFFQSGGVGIYTTSCSGCSVLAEMVPVNETPVNGDIMCTNPDTGKIEICKKDKSDYIKGIAQKFAETVMRMGCSKTLDRKGENGVNIGVVDVDIWQKEPECKGWYPIALSGLSEQTNVVCESPQGKKLGYGDTLVSSNVPGRLRPLDKDEDVKPYQIVGQADSICSPGNKIDSIQVWVQ